MAPFVMNGSTRLACGRRNAAAISLKALHEPVSLVTVEVGLGKTAASVADACLNGLVGDNPHVPAKLSHDLLS